MGPLPALQARAEWEFACRAGTESAFNDGSGCTVPEGEDSALNRLGWYGSNSGGKTHPVGLLKANRWGLHDMHGNVWEWCADERRDYTQSSRVDPVGPMDDTARRAVRGGYCWFNPMGCRSAYRFVIDPGDRIGDLGFRLAAGQPVVGSKSAVLE